MTRETKVGLVVSCSFLSLVGVVLYTKLKEGNKSVPPEYATQDGTLAEAPEEPTLIPEASSPAGTPAAPAKGPEPAKPSPEKHKLDTVPEPPAFQAPPHGANGKIVQTRAVTNETPEPQTNKPSKPPKATTAGNSDNSSAVPVPQFEAPSSDILGGIADHPDHPGHDSAAPRPSTNPEKDVTTPAAPAPANPENVPSKPPARNRQGVSGQPGGGGKKDEPKHASAIPVSAPGMPKAEAAAPAAAAPVVAAPATPFTPPGTPQPEPKKAEAVTPAPGHVPAPMATAPDQLGDTKPEQASQASAPVQTPSASSGPASPMPMPGGNAPANLLPPVANAVLPGSSGSRGPANAATTSSTGGVTPNRPLPTPPAADDAPEPNIRLGSPTSPAASRDQFAQGAAAPDRPAGNGVFGSERPIPPVGAPAAADSPPIRVPLPPGAGQPTIPTSPQVESYDEETYVCKGNDTLESISDQYYHSKDYGQALLLFNRDHPRAAANFRLDHPTLQSGQAMYIPPLRILEKDYAAAIPGHQPVSRAAAPDSPAPAAPSAAPTQASGGTPRYRVRRDNESITDVARTTLGNADRWMEIYILNKLYNPAYPLPVGAVLQLPPNASVPTDNLP
jgi:hypothetical protein